MKKSLSVFFILSVMEGIQSVSYTIIRGHQDVFHSDFPVSTLNALCDGYGYCYCNQNYRTFVFHRKEKGSFGECVKDENVISDTTGKYLPDDSQCLGVAKDGTIKNLGCPDNDLSVRWLWTPSGHMMNLKTLRCLEARTEVGKSRKRNRKQKRRERKVLALKQCDTTNKKQSWLCKRKNALVVANEAIRGYRKKWIMESKKLSSYFSSCYSNRSLYRGCYRFSDGDMLRLVNASEMCVTDYEDGCSIELEIYAPINIPYTICELDRENLSYSINGRDWHHFEDQSNLFELFTRSPRQIILSISNKSSLLTKWSGRLLRLGIQCKHSYLPSREQHCALLKIDGSVTENIPEDHTSFVTPSSTVPLDPNPNSTPSLPSMNLTPSYSIPSTSYEVPSKVSNTDHPPTATRDTMYPVLSTVPPDVDLDSKGRTSNKDAFNIIPIVVPAVVVCCLLLVAIGILLFYRRKESSNTIIQEQDPHIYEETCPQATPEASRHRPAQPVLSIGGAGDNIYQAIDSRPASEIRRPNRDSRPGSGYQGQLNGPFYHTLDRPARSDNNEEGIYQELDDALREIEPVYNRLEGSGEMNV